VLLATTVGETLADFLNTRLGLGLTEHYLCDGTLLLAALAEVNGRTVRHLSPKSAQQHAPKPYGRKTPRLSSSRTGTGSQAGIA
jgi:hypothetical protein